MFGGISAGLLMDAAVRNGAMWQKSLDLGLPHLIIKDEYMSSVPVELNYINGGTSRGSVSHIDHPSFTANRDWLERNGYIKKVEEYHNGDVTLRPFYINGVLFEEGDRFLCAAAMESHLRFEHRCNQRDVFIQNVSLDAVKNGDYKDPTPNSMLISIVDPDMYHPHNVLFKFREVHQFKFLDVDPRYADRRYDPDRIFSEDDAQGIVAALQRASEQNMNVIVHCVAGLYRSGAVVEAAVKYMRFQDTYSIRKRNDYVYDMLEKELTSTKGEDDE